MCGLALFHLHSAEGNLEGCMEGGEMGGDNLRIEKQYSCRSVVESLVSVRLHGKIQQVRPSLILNGVRPGVTST